MPKRKSRKPQPTPPRHPPNEEQATIQDAFLAGGDLLVDAGAGTGKTSTLLYCAWSSAFTKGHYVTFGRAMADDARDKFPGNVEVMTSHGLAWRMGMCERYADRLHRKGRPRWRSDEVAQRLEMNPLQLKRKDDQKVVITRKQLGEIVQVALRRFSHSDRPTFEPWMIVAPDSCDTKESRVTLAEYVIPFLSKAWKDVVDPDGMLPFEQDYYVKIWALLDPQIRTDFIMFDEAQDANPAMASVIMAQKNAQLLLVGDRCQSIYHWRGAVNAMAEFEADKHLFLRQSYRFGDSIAREANKWLAYLCAELRLRGDDEKPSRVGKILAPAAVLCRTNIGAMVEIVDARTKGRSVCFPGRADPLKRFAKAALELQLDGSTSHPDLAGFESWKDLRQYVNDEFGGRDLKTYVELVDKYTAPGIIEILDDLIPQEKEKEADVVVSTAHAAKGREWETVRIADDFKDSADGCSEAEAMLAYVSVTRAMLALDRGPLEYIDEYERDRKTIMDRSAPRASR
jgi:Superfamily I DNA and RNA helicases